MFIGLDLFVLLLFEKFLDGVFVVRECMFEWEFILEFCEYILVILMFMSLLLFFEDWTEGWVGILYLEK